MNNLFFGFIAIATVLIASLEGKAQNYVQAHSVIIVIGGTVAILVFSVPGPVLKSLWKNLVDLTKTDETVDLYRNDILKISQSREDKLRATHKLIAYAQDLWRQGVDHDLFIVLLSQKRRELEAKTSDAVQALKNLSKYPPTLGMTGTVMGMISLFATLDANKSTVGQALSTAMTATFLGLVLANLLISPLADRLHVKQVNQQRMLENMYELLLLINQGEPTALIKEELNERAA
ncbi:MotA/TolQ/ExbB proton channel family protein [Bdellovibrio sp. HCB337]|uniref:MotA/TolQ/ExbB proton channel family protein n=1 Tax=Bdellovibrio sp. HCB337 TaxID=3394358 RepID=UPI0039A6488D